MAPLSSTDVVQLFEWYLNLENRLRIITDVMPLADKKRIGSFDSPRLVPILVEAASITDTVLRALFPDRPDQAKWETYNEKRCRNIRFPPRTRIEAESQKYSNA